MTPDDVRARVRAVAAVRDDPEQAHGMADTLWESVLEAIAAGAEDPRGLAAEALETENIPFPRWYA